MVGGLEDDRIPIIAVSERGRGGLQLLSFDPHADYGPLSGFRSLSGGLLGGGRQNVAQRLLERECRHLLRSDCAGRASVNFEYPLPERRKLTHCLVRWLAAKGPCEPLEAQTC